jgi:hypothetical protein
MRRSEIFEDYRSRISRDLPDERISFPSNSRLLLANLLHLGSLWLLEYLLFRICGPLRGSRILAIFFPLLQTLMTTRDEVDGFSTFFFGSENDESEEDDSEDDAPEEDDNVAPGAR